MRLGLPSPCGAFLPALLLLAVPAAAVAQSGEWTAPRTAFGQPDLQGVWDFATITPLERPEQFGDRAVMTAEESATYERERFALVDHDTEEGTTLVCEGTGNYNEFWFDRGFGDVVEERRTSLIVDPPNGRIPPRAPGAGPAGMRVTERFSSIDADTLRYEFTVEDPNTWTRPWTGVVRMVRSPTPIYEYACHEGNYGLHNILSGARSQEAAAGR